MSNVSRRDFIKNTARLSATALIAKYDQASSESSKKPPNLIIVFPDQMRGQALGFLNEDPVVTPQLNRFSRQSLVLPQAVSNYPVCSPFRAMLMTGKYPYSNGVLWNCTSTSGGRGTSGWHPICELQKSALCWSDILKNKGYSLGYIGKWHLDAPHEPYLTCPGNEGKTKWNEWCPPERRHGFDYWHSYGSDWSHMNPMYWSTNAKRDEFHFANQWSPEHEADKAIDYIRNQDGTYRDANKPFALVVSMNPPHPPYDQFPWWQYLEAYNGKSSLDLIVRPNVDLSGTTEVSKLALEQTKNYFANITGVDEQFGRILKAIDDSGLEDDTIVVFTSDHGNCLGAHNMPDKNVPFEEAMRIPFMIRWPGRIKARHDDLLLSSPDIYPTLLDLMGFGSSIPLSVQGASYADVFLGGKGKRPSSQLYLGVTSERRGIRTHKYKLVITAYLNRPLKSCIYNLKSDPYEMTDIAASNPDLIEHLIKKELRPWLEKTNDPWIKNL